MQLEADPMAVSRRAFLAAAAAAWQGAQRRSAGTPTPRLPPVRAITKAPGCHWFGYYDKLQFDPSSRFCLGMRVDFEHRSPRPDDSIHVGMVDLDRDDRWIELATTRAWCWQQGCMLQWRPGSRTEILYNDREEDRFVSRILDVVSRETRTISRPVYTVSPDGKHAMTLDFARVQVMRPGYGYAGLTDRHDEELAPAESGIFRVDLESGKSELVVPLRDVAAQIETKTAKHYFNHLLFSPDGKRFIFLHRWREGRSGFRTRMLTARSDGSDLRVVDPSGFTSHFIWRDARSILAWTRREKKSGFWLFDDTGEREPELVGAKHMRKNGHCTYLPGAEWILNDTYPDRKRLQHPYLYHVATGRRVALGHFLSPKKYRGEWRCDTHPRFSPDGKRVVIDSPHGGTGRQMWLIDISDIVG